MNQNAHPGNLANLANPAPVLMLCFFFLNLCAGVAQAIPVMHIAYQLDAVPVTDERTLAMLRARTHISVGEPFSRHAVHRSVVALYASAQFSQVTVDAVETQEGVSLLFSLRAVLEIADITISDVPEELRFPLETVLQLQAGGAYHPAVAQRDVASIKNVCTAYGYFDASATAIFSKITRNLTYRIALGAPSLIQAVRIEENTDSETRSLTDALRTSRPGEQYRQAAIERDAVALVALYRERGYLTATARHTFTPETGMLQFFVDAGKRFVFSYLRPNRDNRKNVVIDNVNDGTTERHVNTPTMHAERLANNKKTKKPADIDERELRNLVAALRQSPFLWQQRVKAYFESKGYDSTQVESEEGEERITLTIRPGTRYVVTRVTFSGNLAFSEAVLLREMKTKPQGFFAKRFRKRFFNAQTLETDIDRLTILYRNEGYPDVRIETRIEKDATAGEIAIHVQIAVSAREVIYRCEFNGNRALTEDTLLVALQDAGFSPPQPNARFVQNDYRNAVLRAYQERGFMDVAVNVRYVAKTTEPVFQIEGDAAAEISAALHTGTLSAALRHHFEQAMGMTLPAVSLATQIDTLWSLQDAEGIARYTLHIDNGDNGDTGKDVSAQKPASNTLRTTKILSVFEHHLLAFDISEGEPIHFGTFTFLGDAGVEKEVLTREVKHLEGTLWTPAKLSQAVRNLYTTGIFRRVDAQPGAENVSALRPKNIDIDNGDIGSAEKDALVAETLIKRNVSVQVEKQKPGSYRAGLGYSTTDGFRTTLAMQHRNLYKRNIGVSLRGRAGLRAGTLGYLLESRLTKPWLFGRNRGTLQVSERNLEEDDNVRALQSSVTLSRELSNALLLQFQYNYRFLRQTTPVLNEQAHFSLQGSETEPDLRTTVSSLRLSWTYDSSLPYLAPTSGMLNEVTLEYAGGFLQGESSFIKTTTDLRLYRQLFTAGPTVATALRLGVTNGLRANRGAELISFERFWAGGSTTVRGYAERGLGPLDSAGNHRGDIQFIFNTELRFPIYKPVRGVLFFDTGNVWRSLDTFAFTLAELPAAVGAGIRLQWGAFTGGVDYAVPLRDIPSAAATPLYWRLGSTF